MKTQDLLASWSSLSFEEIQARLVAGGDDGAAEQLLGPNEAAEIRRLAARRGTRGPREAVVLLPGIMGSLLSSVRGVTTLLWINPAIFLNGKCRYLELNADGTRDGCPNIEAVPISLEKLVYLKLGLALSGRTDLYEFPYDWRRPIEWNGDVLHECIERWADGKPELRFTLVGHSMGGLVARAYLARHTRVAERRVKGLIMHGTPHFGAANALENLITGNQMMAIVNLLNGQNEPRRLLLNLPSVYQLLPAPPDLFPSGRPYPANWDVYDATAWHLEGIRADYLAAGRRFHELLAGADPQVPMTEIAGCHLPTVVEVQRALGPDNSPHSEFVRTAEGSDSGDGTVPLWSALLPRATIYYIQHRHRDLPSNNKVIQATMELIHGGTPDLPTQLPPRKPGLFRRGVLAPPEVEAERLRACLQDGTASDEDLSRLYFAL